MHPRSLTKILNQHNVPANFDLLSIDAEEHDLSVLRSLDFNKYSPRLIIVEAENFNPNFPSEDPLYQFLIGKLYRFEGSILKNLYFSRTTNN